jgi:hypothetical protein
MLLIWSRHKNPFWSAFLGAFKVIMRDFGWFSTVVYRYLSTFRVHKNKDFWTTLGLLWLFTFRKTAKFLGLCLLLRRQSNIYILLSPDMLFCYFFIHVTIISGERHRIVVMYYLNVFLQWHRIVTILMYSLNFKIVQFYSRETGA